MPHFESKRVRCGRLEQNIVVQTWRHANSLLDSNPFVYCMASPAGILGDQRLPAFLKFSGCLI